MSNGAADLWGADRIGGNWTGAYNITGYNGSWNVGGNSLSAGPNGDAYLTWVSPAPGWVGIGFARYDAASKKWQPRHDNIANTPVGFGGFKNISIAASSNGTIWIAFTLDNQTTPSRSGAYYMVSGDNGGSWSELRDITRQENAGDSNLYAYGGNVYFVALFNRVTQFTYRSQ